MRLRQCVFPAVFAFVFSLHATADDAAPAMQKPADQRAFNAANAITDPAARLAAYEDVIKTYPKSRYASYAQNRRLHLLLEDYPDRTDAIRTSAKAEIASDGNGFGHLEGEAEVAERLSEAGPHGVLLPEAERWAKDAERHLDEAKWTAERVEQFKKYGLTSTKEELQRDYAKAAANIHLALADVYLHEGRLAEAKPLLDGAYAVQPDDMTTNAVMGEFALAQHDDKAALTFFERAAVGQDDAEVFSDLAKKYQPTLVSLYKEAHDGSDAGLEGALDAQYRELFPPPFMPGKPDPVHGQHTALLELFTGSGCPPCIGADEAVEALLGQYSREQLIVLSFDQHIPRPDPLANPASLARADFYKRTGTPNYALDGTPLTLYGATRETAKDLYRKLAYMVSTEANAPTDVTLTLAPAVRGTNGDVTVAATVTTGPESATTGLVLAPKETAPPPTPEEKAAAAAATAAAAKGSKKPDAAAKPAAAAAPARPSLHLVVNFALVEDDVRYSGENGLRFHRMVVRALAEPADGGLPVTVGGTSSASATFDPGAVSTQLKSYLAGYAQGNANLGPLQWRSTPVALDRPHLYVVAWVQDLGTHRVLQAAMTPALYPAGAAEARGSGE